MSEVSERIRSKVDLRVATIQSATEIVTLAAKDRRTVGNLLILEAELFLTAVYKDERLEIEKGLPHRQDEARRAL